MDKSVLTYTYDVPSSVSTSISAIVVKELTVAEEEQVYKRAAGNNLKVANEAAKASLVEITVDGEVKQLRLHDGTVEQFWNTASPLLRQLIATAYADVNMAKDEDVKPFLASKKIRAG